MPLTSDVAVLPGASTLPLETCVSSLAESGLLAVPVEAGGTAEPGYRPALDSDVADLAHTSRAATARPGSIIAALFLREFTAGRPWAHLDIAGAGRSTQNDGELAKGATGFGTRLLLRLLAEPS